MRSALVALLIAWLLPAAVWPAARFAIVLGNDEGGSGRARLWYAERDATRFAEALTELGDFPREHVVVLKEARLPQVQARLRALESQIAEARKKGERTLLLFYFSGHANERGLELGTDSLPFAELRRTLTESSSDTRIAVVDACGAGALTQVKGGRPWLGVDFPLPAEEQVEGVAFLASTAVGEPAQESSALQGSFFTTHLEAALRGAGDLDGDGRVTLTEAFLYTSTRTMSDTAQTKAGTQHPTYDTRLSGRGDVVLADLRRAEATLVLPAADGAVYLLHGPNQFLAEVPGMAHPVQLALSAGAYSVERRKDDALETAQITLTRGERKDLPPMVSKPLSFWMSKGMRGPYEISAGVAISSGLMLHAGGAWSGRLAGARVVGPVRLRLLVQGGSQSVADAGLLYDLVSVGGAGAVLYPLVWFPARLEVGLQGGGSWLRQQLEGGRTLSAVAGHGEALLLLSYPLVGPIRAGTELSAGVEWLPLNGSLVNRFAATAAITAAAEF